MDKLGTHLLLDMKGVEASLLDDIRFTKKVMLRAVSECGATLLNSQWHLFEPQGLTYIALLSESHLSIHTWPEKGYAAVDVFTCGDHVDTYKALWYIIDMYNPTSHKIKEVMR
jgi:S-adenosylmethionine decarboxylase